MYEQNQQLSRRLREEARKLRRILQPTHVRAGWCVFVEGIDKLVVQVRPAAAANAGRNLQLYFSVVIVVVRA